MSRGIERTAQHGRVHGAKPWTGETSTERWIDVPRIAAQLCSCSAAVLALKGPERAGHAVVVGEVPPSVVQALINDLDAQRSGDDVVVVQDVRTGKPPWLSETTGDFRFVARVTIGPTTDGYRGALAVVDRQPHTLSGDQLEGLGGLARHVEFELEAGPATDHGVRDRDHRAIVEAANAARIGVAVVAGVDEDEHRIVHVNTAAARLLGYDPEELVGRPSLDLLTRAERERLLGERAGKAPEAGPAFIETIVQRPDGTQVPISVGIARGEYRGEPATFAFLHDITLRRSMERALEERDRTLQTIIQEAPLVLFAVDPDGNITLAEGSGLERLGVRAEDLVGNQIHKLLEANPDELNALERALDGQAVHVDVERADAAYHVRLTPISDPDGSVQYVIGVATDITEQRRAERSARAAHERIVELKRREAVRRAKMQLLNAASHALNTPLTPLKLKAHMLSTGMLGPLNDRQTAALEVIDRNVAQLSALVDEILDMVRLQSALMDLRRRPVDIARLVGEVVRSFQAAAAKRGVQLVHEVDGRTTIDADPARVRQVVQQFIDRALESAGEGGTVRVRTVFAEGDVRIRITDTGTPLSGELADEVDAFLEGQMEETMLTQLEFGVAVVVGRAVAEAHGGRLRYIRATADGLTGFEVSLPAAPGPVPGNGP